MTPVARVASLARVASGELEDERACEVVLDALEDVEPSVRRAAVGVAQVRLLGPVAGALSKRLTDDEAEVRLAAVRALGVLAALKIVDVPAEVFFAALSDVDVQVRAHAERAVGEVGARDPSIVARLVAGLDEPGHVLAVVRVLERLGSVWAPWAEEVAARAPAQGVEGQRAIVRALHALGDVGAEWVLWIFDRLAVEVRVWSVQMATAEHLALLCLGLTDVRPGVRLAALERVGRERAVWEVLRPEVERRLQDTDPEVRAVAGVLSADDRVPGSPSSAEIRTEVPQTKG